MGTGRSPARADRLLHARRCRDRKGRRHRAADPQDAAASAHLDLFRRLDRNRCGDALSLGQRTRLDLAVQHERSPLFVQLSDGHIRNNYTLKLRNMETRPRRVAVSVSGLPGAVLWTEISP